MSTIIKLGMHPFADTFISEDQYSQSEPVYPLECVLNKSSGEIKLKHKTVDDDRYNLYDYSYTSSNSKISKQHWVDYANVVDKILSRNSKLLEVGSNDGFLTEQFINKGHDAYGVDPSKMMVEVAKTRNVKTFNMIFNLKNCKTIKNSIGEVDIVIANNVFNHANDPDNFLTAVKEILNREGLFMFELPYWLHTVRDKKFDQIYHEHVTYFTVKYAHTLLKKQGFHICKAEVVDYHGGSLRILSKKASNYTIEEHVKDMISKEEKYGLFDTKMYSMFMKTLLSDRNKIMSKLYQIKNQGTPIIGIGAAAKANTFLNFYKIDNTILDYVTDASDFKKGKYTPLTRIPIVDDKIFSEYDEVYALILSWNISSMLKSKIKNINPKVKFLSIEELL